MSTHYNVMASIIKAITESKIPAIDKTHPGKALFFGTRRLGLPTCFPPPSTGMRIDRLFVGLLGDELNRLLRERVLCALGLFARVVLLPGISFPPPS